MNNAIPERFMGLATFGTHPDLDSADLVAAAVNSYDEALYRMWPSTEWPADPTAKQMHALPWLGSFHDLELFQLTPEEIATRISDQLHVIEEQSGVLVVWDAPLTLGLLYGHRQTLELPTRIIDVKVLDRQLNPERKGRRTLWTTHDFYELDEVTNDPAGYSRALVETALEMLEQHQLAMPLVDLTGQQKVWYREQSVERARWLMRHARPLSYVDTGWPLRNDQRRWHADLQLTEWLDGTPIPDADLRSAVRTLLTVPAVPD